jgi:aspartyl/asparaginyl-tRNA synthetase
MTRINGFVATKRVLKRMIFIVLRNRAGSIQITVERPSELEQTAAELTLGSAIAVEGEVVSNPNVKDGGQEMIPSSIDVVGAAEPELPIQDASASELQLDWRFLALRRPRNQLVLEVQTTVERAMRSYWAARGFIELHSPKLMHSASESGSETFSTPYFDLGRAYLAQSPQFYKQMAMAAGLERVFEIGPVFRAEPSMTPRHATEFTSVDVEISWIASHEDVMAFEEAWLRHVILAVREAHGLRIEQEFGVEIADPVTPFPRISLAHAHRLLREMGHTIPSVTKAGDIDPEGERLIASRMRDERGSAFVFLTDYPAALRPFYHMRHPDNPGLTRSFDLLWNGIEITTGAQREHRFPILRQQAQEAGLGESVAYYLDFFRYGCPPHGGFGLGLARIVMLLLGLPSIREAVFLHRSPNRLTP